MVKRRKRWPAKEKLRIIQECQQSGASIAEVCRRNGVNTSQYYQWLRQTEQGALQALEGKLHDKPSRREERLRRELERMKDVVAEITAENVDLKKSLGE